MTAFRIFRRLSELLDVTVATPTDGQVLTYDTGTSKWRNEAASGGGSGTAVTSETVTVTLNEANNWTAAHAIDMGSGGVLVGYSAVLMSTTPDGETFGTGSGELGVDSTLGFSIDGISYGGTAGRLASGEDLDANFYMSVVSQRFAEAWARYARSLHSIRVEETDSVYAGPNSPVATVNATLTWLPGDSA